MDAMVIALLAWITLNAGLKAPEPPKILFLPKAGMNELYYGKSVVKDSTFDLKAFYDREGRTIYLPHGWNSADLLDNSILLHELVHHWQRMNGLKLSCPAEFERQAIELQSKWLLEQGIANPYQALGLDAFSVRILLACPETE